MSYLKLVKLLYFADREHIRLTGTSITKDTFFSMKNGPVLSNVLDLIHTGPEPDRLSYWDSIISGPTANYEVNLIKIPEYDALSKASREIADRVFEKFGHLSRWKVRDISHALDEYSPLDNSGHEIEFRDIASALSFPEELIVEYEEEEKTNTFVHSVLGVQG